MKKPLFQHRHARRFDRGERGITMVLVALAMIAMIAMAALSIDVVTLYVSREEAQRSADAAALAAARIISVSGITGQADPGTDTTDWQAICGNSTTAFAYLAALGAAQVNGVNGSAPTLASITYSAQGASGGVTDCSTLSTAFAINPTVTVKVSQGSLPTLFSRIWSRSANSVTATATAEAFNPSNSGSIAPGGEVIPVTPHCVKPWIVPNRDPVNLGSTFVDKSTGAIQSPGIQAGGSGTATGAVIGESFTVTDDCTGSGNCSTMVNNPPNATAGVLYYIPAYVTSSAEAYPSCADDSLYQEAIGGCDVNTVYACGTSGGAQADLTINPGGGSGDTATAAKCVTHDLGKDTMNYVTYPFQITSGGGNPIVKNQLVTSSNSIMTLPIYDDTQGPLSGSYPTITVVGYLHVFVDSVNGNGDINVHVLNVAGCGNAASPTLSAPGTSPVPIRLITSQ
jgi:Flp pilus assembly protein TadG